MSLKTHNNTNQDNKLIFLQAAWLFLVTAPAIPKGVIVANKDGKIIQILSSDDFSVQYPSIKTDYYKGALVPGFINAHAHLELSHLYQKSDKNQGLPQFLLDMIDLREGFDKDEIMEAMQKADAEMYANGIVAVGDISNHARSSVLKKKSPIYYHTFIETMGFLPHLAQSRFDYALQVASAFTDLPHAIVPHAPYSMSEKLYALIAAQNADLCSIHNQECAAENDFFEQKAGDFISFYQTLGNDISHFEASSKRSLPYYLPHINTKSKTLLVHNSFTNENDIDFALQTHSQLYWCLCPNANLYIENVLPPLALFQQKGLKIVLGTDSLASNNQLSIANEMWVLQENLGAKFEDLLQMATQNGAEFLNIDTQFGCLEIGKKPGIVWMDIDENKKMCSAQVKRIL